MSPENIIKLVTSELNGVVLSLVGEKPHYFTTQGNYYPMANISALLKKRMAITINHLI